METVCQLSYPLNSEKASPPGTCTVYLPCPASFAVTALPPTTSEPTMTTTAASALRFISTPLLVVCCDSAFERTRARDDDLRSVSLLAEDGDLGARLAVLYPTAGDDPSRREWFVRPQHVGELHVQAAAQVEAAAEMPGQELGDARERHAAPDHGVSEAELFRGGLVVVIVPAAEEELVAHRFGERLVELDRQRLPGRLTLLPRAFLARRIAQGDLAAGLLRQEALVMDAARDQVSSLVAHPHLLRDDLTIAPPVAIGHPRAAAQNLSNARRRMD